MSFLKKLVIIIRKGVIPGSARYEFNVRDPPWWEARIQIAVSGSSPYNVPEIEITTLKPTTVQAKRCMTLITRISTDNPIRAHPRHPRNQRSIS